MRTLARRFACWGTLASIAIVFAASDRTLQGAESTMKKPAVKRARGRLPPHYGKVASEEQRAQIYQIQEEYKPKIEAMETQLNALKKERDDKITAVLTPEQKKKVAEAATRGRAGKVADTPAETPPNPKTAQ